MRLKGVLRSFAREPANDRFVAQIIGCHCVGFRRNPGDAPQGRFRRYAECLARLAAAAACSIGNCELSSIWVTSPNAKYCS
jgi:hypothetical protein